MLKLHLNCCSVTMLRPILCDLMSGFPVLRYLLSLLKLMSIELWCIPTVSSSVIPFSCLLSFLASRSFLVSKLFIPGGHRIGAPVSVLPINIQGWLSLGLIDLLAVESWESQEASPASQFKSINSFVLSRLYGPILTWLLEKLHLWLCRPLSAKWCLCFLMLLSRFLITFLPRSKHP